MSWLFSQALVAEYSRANCLGGEPCAQLSVMPTPHKVWHNDKPMEASNLSRFGLTCAALTADRGAELLTWFLEDSRARTSAPQATGLGLTASDLGSGARWRELSVRYDRDTSSWRTHHSLWDEDLSACSLTLPKWGLMLDGVLWEQDTSALGTFGSAAGSWLPTLGKNEYKGAGKDRFRGSEQYRGAKMSEGLRTCANDPIYLTPSFAEHVMGWPDTWTELAPLATGKYQSWLRAHGKC